MKTKFLLFVALTFISHHLVAQGKSVVEEKYLVGISIGSSIPIGNFGSMDTHNSSAGLAKTGPIFDVSFVYKFNQNIGISALMRGQSNGVNPQVMADGLAASLPSGSGAVTVKASGWSAAYYMAGYYGAFPITEKLSFESRAMIGFANATSPMINMNVKSSSSTVEVDQSSKNGFAVSYLLGVGFKMNVGAKRMYLAANFDYTGAKPEFRNVPIHTTGSTSAIIASTTTFSQSFESMNIGFGIGWRFVGKSSPAKATKNVDNTDDYIK